MASFVHLLWSSSIDKNECTAFLAGVLSHILSNFGSVSNFGLSGDDPIQSGTYDCHFHRT